MTATSIIYSPEFVDQREHHPSSARRDRVAEGAAAAERSPCAGATEAGRQGVLPDRVQGRRVYQVTGELVLPRQAGVAHDRVVGAERDADARRCQRRELVPGATGGRAGLDVAGDGDLEGHAGGGEMRQQPRVLGAPDAVPDALRVKTQRIPDAVRAGRLARVDRHREAVLTGKAERGGEERRRVPGLVPGEI